MECYESETCDRCDGYVELYSEGEFRGREDGEFKVYCRDCNVYLLGQEHFWRY